MRWLVASLLVLSGCSTVPRVEVVEVLPPDGLMGPCEVPERELRTNGDLAAHILDLRGALGLCNNQLEALREWAERP
jgi:hypothetical protein